MRRILALTRYGCEAASTRQRFDQFRPALQDAGFDLAIEPFFDDSQTATINRGEKLGFSGVVRAYARRARKLRNLENFDLLWVQYEIFPFLPSAIEKLAGRHVPVIVDFDDAYYLRYDLSSNRVVRTVLTDKMRPLVSSASTVVVGNDILADHFFSSNLNIKVIPTVVDTDAYVPLAKESDHQLTIGWIGSPTTWRVYVRPYVPFLREICRKHSARMLVIGAGEDGDHRIEEFEYRDWSDVTEISDIQEMDIGIMPLPDDPWARGKCGYKLIQYMACGLPTVASPVGVNCKIVDSGRTGFLARSEEEWCEALVRLVADPARRHSMGRAGRARVERDFSLAVAAPKVVEIFGQAGSS